MTWAVQYGIGGKERELPLGPVTALDPSKARALPKDLLARVRLAEDRGREAGGRGARARNLWHAIAALSRLQA